MSGYIAQRHLYIKVRDFRFNYGSIAVGTWWPLRRYFSSAEISLSHDLLKLLLSQRKVMAFRINNGNRLTSRRRKRMSLTSPLLLNFMCRILSETITQTNAERKPQRTLRLHKVHLWKRAPPSRRLPLLDRQPPLTSSIAPSLALIHTSGVHLI